MRKGNRTHAIERSQLARSAKGIGDLITKTAKARRTGGIPPIPPEPAGAVVGESSKKGRRACRKSTDTEAVVLRSCLKWLHKRGVFAWRNNTGTLWTNGQPVSFGYPGSSDILGLLPTGRMLAVECKSTTGRQSQKQKAFEAKVKANGGVYILARGVEDLERGLQWDE